MIFDFLKGILLGFVFFWGIAGIGWVLVRFLQYEGKNTYLNVAVGFFLSLCLYIFGAVGILFVVPDKLLCLKLFSLLYFSCSYLILFFKIYNAGMDNFLLLTRKSWKAGIGLLLVILILFLGTYQTALLDEWLHRPIVDFFTKNGIFPLINPWNPDQKFIFSYHYGMQIAAAALKIMFSLTASDALDVVKISSAVGTFFLFTGIVYNWSKSVLWSVIASILILFCGASFFLWDEFTLEHLQLWGTPMVVMNYPLLYLLFGISWVYLPITIAFILVSEDVFYRRIKLIPATFILGLPILAGFFLIGELFAVLMLLVWLFLFVRNWIQNKINRKKSLLVATLLSVVLIGSLFIFGGAIGRLWRRQGAVAEMLVLKNPGLWGYPTGGEPVRIWQFPEIYLRNFFLQMLLIGVIVYALFAKKLTLNSNPIFYFLLPITLLVPFFFSTSYGNLNLYKLAHLGILLLSLLFFRYYFEKGNKMWLNPIIALFVIGSLSVILVSASIRWGNGARADSLRCVKNNLCENKSAAGLLRNFDQDNPGIKRLLVHPSDVQLVIDNSNSVVIQGQYRLTPEILEKNRVEYIFLSSKLDQKLDDESIDLLEKYPVIYKKDDFEILRVK